MKRLPLALLFAVWSSVCCAAFPDGWAGYAKCTLTNPTIALTGFTLFISAEQFPSDFWTAVAAAGGDLVVTDENNTRLPIDIISFTDSGSSGSGLIAVKRDLASSGTQELRFWIGKSGESQPAAGDTYGQYAAYTAKGFWPSGGGNDRTSAGYNGTANGGVSVGGASGPINGSAATTFDGTNDYINTGSRAGATPASWLMYVKPSSLNTMVWLGQYSTSPANAYLQIFSVANGTVTFRIHGTTPDTLRIGRTTNSGALVDDTAGFWGFTWSGGTSNAALKIYKNGSAVDTTNDGAGAFAGIDSDSIPFQIGAQNGGTGGAVNSFFAGDLGMVMAYDVELSSAWVSYWRSMLADADQSDFLGTWTWVANTPADSTGNFFLLLGSYRTHHHKHHACWGDESKPLFTLAA